MKPMIDAIAELEDALVEAAIPHAFGGALALAWCTKDPRATNDVDLNIFLGVDQVEQVVAALPVGIKVSDRDREALNRDGQRRLFWDGTPVDLFFSTTTFHKDVASRVVRHRFLDRDIPFLCCTDLAVFKALFNRPKDWVDLAEMISRQTVNEDAVLGAIVRYLGPDDERVGRFRALLSAPPIADQLPNVRDLIAGD
jgi:hypothetical protein